MLTGLPDETDQPSFAEVFASAGGEEGASPLVLWTVAQMAQIAPWAMGAASEWEEAADRLFARARALHPQLTAADFAGLGSAGDYFQHIFQLA